MNYSAEDVDEKGNPTPRGEICIRGPGVMIGYYKAPELTNEAIDSNKWLHTGDVGMIGPDGRLKIIDRKKKYF